MIRTETPWLDYRLKSGLIVHVKREDLCMDGAAFSKVRGVEKHLTTRKELNIGVLDSLHSKAGWGVSQICKEMGKKAVVFYPRYKGETGLRENQIKCRKEGADLVPLQATASYILKHRAARILSETYKDSYMLPNGLQLSESVHETALEVRRNTPESYFFNSVWVISVSTGTIAAGVITGIASGSHSGIDIVLVKGYSDRKNKSILKKIREYTSMNGMRITIIDGGYNYKDAVEYPCPFPSNEYYDLKAWKWLDSARLPFNKQIIFWNIGK